MGYYSVEASVIIHSNYSPDTTREVSVSRNAYVANQGDPAYVYVSLPNSPVFSRAGYDFVGYGSNSSMSSLAYHPGDSLTFVFYRSQTQNIHVYSLWQLKTYTVSYNANGGTGAPASQTKTYGVNLTLSSTIPTRQYYNFKGWATSPNGSVVYAAGGTYSANAAVTLYAVWELAAAPLTSVSNTEVGSSGTASWTKLDNAHSYKLVLTCGSAPSVTVNSAAGTTSCSFTIPNTWLNYITDSASATATATLTTYNGDTALGSTTMSFTVTVPSSIKPTISSFTASHYSANATVSGWGVFTQGFSCADLSVSATPGTGASIASITFVGPSVNSTGASTTKRTGILGSSGTNTFTVTVADSRGRTATTTVSVNVYPYSAPTVIAINTMRADADGTTNNSGGAYLKVQPVYSLSSVNGNNSFTVQTLKYFEHGSSTPQATITCASGTTYGPPGNSWAINLADSYDISVSLTDALGGVVTATVTLPGAAGIWYSRANNALGLGAAPTRANLFSCDWDTELHGTLDVVKRRCSATLSSAGWYRVFLYSSTNDDELAGGKSANIRITITREGIAGNSFRNEVHFIDFSLAYGSYIFSNETSVTQSLAIDKIRYGYDLTNHFGFIDIHCKRNDSNPITVSFNVATDLETQGEMASVEPYSVADAPSGETVLATHDFVANTHISGSVVGSYGTIYYDRKGGVCSIYGDVNGVPTGAWTTLATGLPAPARTQFFIAQNGASTDFVMCQLNTSGELKFYGRGSYSSGYPTWTYVCN